MERIRARLSAVAVLELALVTPVVAQTPPPLPEPKFAEISARDKYLGDRWSYMEAGRTGAPVIVLLHGVGANSMHWRYQFAGLSDAFRVVAWNAPGYMLSDAFKADWPTCQDYSDALSDFLLAAVKLDRVNIVGNSFGSRVAQCFAIHQPSRVIKLAMTGTGIGPKGMSEEEKAKIIAAREGQIAKGGYGFGARVNALLGKNASEQTINLVRDVVRATSPRGFMHGVKLGMVDGYDPETVAAKVTAPVLMISGSEDRVNPIDKNAAILAKAMPKRTRAVLDCTSDGALNRVPTIPGNELRRRSALAAEQLAADMPATCFFGIFCCSANSLQTHRRRAVNVRGPE